MAVLHAIKGLGRVSRTDVGASLFSLATAHLQTTHYRGLLLRSARRALFGAAQEQRHATRSLAGRRRPRRAPVRIGAEISSTEETVEALGAGRWAPGSTPAWWPSTVPRWCIATGSQSGPSPTCRLVTGLRMAPRRRPPAARRVALRGGRRPLRRVDQAGPARQCTAIRTLWPRRPCSTRFRCNWLRRRGRRRAACRSASLSIQKLSKKIGLRGRGE
jgi:hypothetical protein